MVGAAQVQDIPNFVTMDRAGTVLNLHGQVIEKVYIYIIPGREALVSLLLCF